MRPMKLTGRIAAGILILTAIVLHYWFGWPSALRARSMGPGWECTNPGKGDDVCFKDAKQSK